jgi:hypothetical protein
MNPKFIGRTILASVLGVGFSGCGTLNQIGHARISNDGLFPPALDTSAQSVQQAYSNAESAFVVEVDGQPARSGPLPALEDTGVHPAAWVSAGKHLFKVGITSVVQRPGVTNPITYVTFSATVRSETTYLLVAADAQPMLFERKTGPGKNSFPPRNQPIPLTIVDGH